MDRVEPELAVCRTVAVGSAARTFAAARSGSPATATTRPLPNGTPMCSPVAELTTMSTPGTVVASPAMRTVDQPAGTTASSGRWSRSLTVWLTSALPSVTAAQTAADLLVSGGVKERYVAASTVAVGIGWP